MENVQIKIIIKFLLWLIYIYGEGGEYCVKKMLSFTR